MPGIAARLHHPQCHASVLHPVEREVRQRGPDAMALELGVDGEHVARSDREEVALTAAVHHTAYTFQNIDDLLERYVLLRDKGVVPAVCIAHGVTSSMYYRDPDGNFVELQIDAFDTPDEATAYMNGPEYAADSVGPGFDPQVLLEARRDGASVEELTARSFCSDAGMPPPIEILTSAP